jgi:hypothetical protein
VPSSSFPGRAGALDTASADQAARVGGVAGAPRPAGGERGLRDCSSPAARRAGRPSRPRSRPPPLRGLRLLPSHTLPGRPGPQAFPALLLPLSTFAPARVLLLPAGLAASGASPFPRALLSHTRALACWAAPFSPACPLTPPSGGGGLMSLQHHAAAAEEGKDAAGVVLWSLVGMLTTNAVRATTAPPPPSRKGLLVCHRVAAGSRRRGGRGSSPLLCWRPQDVPRVSGVCLCVCACMAVLPTAKCILRAAPRGGGSGGWWWWGLQICRALCVIV